MNGPNAIVQYTAGFVIVLLAQLCCKLQILLAKFSCASKACTLQHHAEQLHNPLLQIKVFLQTYWELVLKQTRES